MELVGDAQTSIVRRGGYPSRMKLITLAARISRRGRARDIVLRERRGPPAGRGVSRAESSTEGETARVVPWHVVRRTDKIVEVEHRGVTPLHSVRFALAGSGVIGLSLPRTVHSGERLMVRIGEVRNHPRSMLVLRWFEPEGTELLWPIAL